MQSFKNGLVVGAGTMGMNLAKLMLGNGMTVTVLDINPNVLDRCRQALEFDPASKVQAHFVSDWLQVGECDVVLESVTEDLALKQRVLKDVEAHVGDATLILTNTSGLSIDELSDVLTRPERFVGAHFFNPADLIPTVEVIPGRFTSDTFVDHAVDLLRGLGKRPAVLKQSVPGFVANRIQHALMRECLSILEQGVVDAETLDDIVRYSIGIRLAINGPLRQRDLNGLDTHLNISSYLYQSLDNRTTPSPLLEALVEKGYLGRKSGNGFYEWPAGSGENYDRQERELLVRLLSMMKED